MGAEGRYLRGHVVGIHVAAQRVELRFAIGGTRQMTVDLHRQPLLNHFDKVVPRRSSLPGANVLVNRRAWYLTGSPRAAAVVSYLLATNPGAGSWTEAIKHSRKSANS